jgi:hypothetical protein
MQDYTIAMTAKGITYVEKSAGEIHAGEILAESLAVITGASITPNNYLLYRTDNAMTGHQLTSARNQLRVAWHGPQAQRS